MQIFTKNIVMPLIHHNMVKIDENYDCNIDPPVD
jgi:hypothetical protein